MSQLSSTQMTIAELVNTNVYDGMYAVYLIKEDKWALYSSADGSIFKKRDSLDDVI